MRERTVLGVLTDLLVDEGLAILGFVASWMVELLDFIVCELALSRITWFCLALNVRVSSFARIATLVTVVMVESAAGQLVHVGRLLTIGAYFRLERFKVEPEELVPHQ